MPKNADSKSNKTAKEAKSDEKFTSTSSQDESGWDIVNEDDFATAPQPLARVSQQGFFGETGRLYNNVMTILSSIATDSKASYSLDPAVTAYENWIEAAIKDTTSKTDNFSKLLFPELEKINDKITEIRTENSPAVQQNKLFQLVADTTSFINLTKLNYKEDAANNTIFTQFENLNTALFKALNRNVIMQHHIQQTLPPAAGPKSK